eukprot:scaffold219001_cov21-Tisochrysis_lutea.AAC.2
MSGNSAQGVGLDWYQLCGIGPFTEPALNHNRIDPCPLSALSFWAPDLLILERKRLCVLFWACAPASIPTAHNDINDIKTVNHVVFCMPFLTLTLFHAGFPGCSNHTEAALGAPLSLLSCMVGMGGELYGPEKDKRRREWGWVFERDLWLMHLAKDDRGQRSVRVEGEGDQREKGIGIVNERVG